MFRNCARIAVLGTVAAVAAAAQGLSGHSIEYDLITLAVQTQVEAVLPVVSSLANNDISKIAVAWSDKFRKSATSGTMTVQGNADNMNDFLTKAAKVSPSFVRDVNAALSEAAIDFFEFHSFMPAATWDVVEYGVVNSGSSFNKTKLNMVKDFLEDHVDTTDVDDLQDLLDAYISAEEKKNSGFKIAVEKVISAAYKAVWTNNPTRAPTTAPTTTTPSVTTTSPTKAPTNETSVTNSTSLTNSTASSTNTTDTSNNSSSTPPSTTYSPDLYIGEPMPMEGNSSAAPATAVPTPAPTTKKSGAPATAVGVVVSAVVFTVASAIM